MRAAARPSGRARRRDRSFEPEQAVQIVLSQARTLVGQGRRQTLDAWIGRLPASLVQRTPWLVYWQATGRVAVDSTEARGQLEFAFGRFRAESNVVGQVLAALGIIESVYFGFFSGAVSGSVEQWMDALDQALRCTPEASDPGL